MSTKGSRQGLTISREKESLPHGSPLVRRDADDHKCCLGGLTKKLRCGGDVATKIGKYGICQKHWDRLKAIKKAADKKKEIGRTPQTQVFRRANAA